MSEDLLDELFAPEERPRKEVSKKPVVESLFGEESATQTQTEVESIARQEQSQTLFVSQPTESQTSSPPQVSASSVLSQPPQPPQPSQPPQPAPPMAEVVKPEAKGEIIFTSEEEPSPKEVYMIYGYKGHGKTYFALSFPGSIRVLSFDHKAVNVAHFFFTNRFRSGQIKIYNVMKYVDFSEPSKFLETCEKTYNGIIRLIESFRNDPPDWIVLDGTELMQQLCEMVMRYRNNLMPYEGIRNLNLWKERRLYIREICLKALDVVRRGLIFTAYVDVRESIYQGDSVRREMPKWIDFIEYFTDTVIRVLSTTDTEGKRRFLALVESSKTWMPTGEKFDITDRGLQAIIEVCRSRGLKVPYAR